MGLAKLARGIGMAICGVDPEGCRVGPGGGRVGPAACGVGPAGHRVGPAFCISITSYQVDGPAGYMVAHEIILLAT